MSQIIVTRFRSSINRWIYQLRHLWTLWRQGSAEQSRHVCQYAALNVQPPLILSCRGRRGRDCVSARTVYVPSVSKVVCGILQLAGGAHRLANLNFFLEQLK